MIKIKINNNKNYSLFVFCLIIGVVFFTNINNNVLGIKSILEYKGNYTDQLREYIANRLFVPTSYNTEERKCHNIFLRNIHHKYLKHMEQSDKSDTGRKQRISLKPKKSKKQYLCDKDGKYTLFAVFPDNRNCICDFQSANNDPKNYPEGTRITFSGISYDNFWDFTYWNILEIEGYTKTKEFLKNKNINLEDHNVYLEKIIKNRQWCTQLHYKKRYDNAWEEQTIDISNTEIEDELAEVWNNITNVYDHDFPYVNPYRITTSNQEQYIKLFTHDNTLDKTILATCFQKEIDNNNWFNNQDLILSNTLIDAQDKILLFPTISKPKPKPIKPVPQLVQAPIVQPKSHNPISSNTYDLWACNNNVFSSNSTFGNNLLGFNNTFGAGNNLLGSNNTFGNNLWDCNSTFGAGNNLLGFDNTLIFDNLPNSVPGIDHTLYVDPNSNILYNPKNIKAGEKIIFSTNNGVSLNLYDFSDIYYKIKNPQMDHLVKWAQKVKESLSFNQSKKIQLIQQWENNKLTTYFEAETSSAKIEITEEELNTILALYRCAIFDVYKEWDLDSKIQAQIVEQQRIDTERSIQDAKDKEQTRKALEKKTQTQADKIKPEEQKIQTIVAQQQAPSITKIHVSNQPGNQQEIKTNKNVYEPIDVQDVHNAVSSKITGEKKKIESDIKQKVNEYTPNTINSYGTGQNTGERGTTNVYEQPKAKTEVIQRKPLDSKNHGDINQNIYQQQQTQIINIQQNIQQHIHYDPNNPNGSIGEGQIENKQEITQKAESNNVVIGGIIGTVGIFGTAVLGVLYKEKQKDKNKKEIKPIKNKKKNI